MKWKFLFTAALALMVGVGNAVADGGTYTMKKRDGTTLGIEIAEDDTLLVRGTALFDGGISTSMDTTVASAGVNKLLAVNLYDPNQMGWYRGSPPRLQSAIRAFRAVEKNNSLWRDEGIEFPAFSIINGTGGGDTLEVWDLATATKTLTFLTGAGNYLNGTKVGDIGFKDGHIILGGSDDDGVYDLDFWADMAYRYKGSASYIFGLPLSSRNSVYQNLSSALPYVIDGNIRSVGVVRSPFTGAGGVDIFGRQRPVWAAGTDGGASVLVYDKDGKQYLYDSNSTTDVDAMTVLDNGVLVTFSDAPTPDECNIKYSIHAVAGDSWTYEADWDAGGTDSEDIIWGADAAFSDVAALPGISSAGNNSPRLYIASSDSGMVIIDSRISDNQDGMQQYISEDHVTPVLAGDVILAFSPASSAQVIGAFSTAGTACSYVATSDGPLSHAWRFDGSNDAMNISDALSDLGDDTSGSIDFWVKPDDGQPAAAQRFLSFGDADAEEYMSIWVHTDGTVFAANTDGGTAQWSMDTNSAVFVDSAAAWTHIALVHNATVPTLYINGEPSKVTFTVDTDKTDWFATLDGLDVGEIGALQYNSGTLGGFFDGDMTPPTFTADVLTAAQIQAIYNRGVKFINSATPDTLYGGGDVDYVAADPSGMRVAWGDETHVEIRDADGALIDTLHCSACGNLAAVAFMQWPWADSLGVVMGGSTGWRYIGVDPNFVDLSTAEWPERSEYIIQEAAVVDSAGHGDFWTVPDAVTAISNAGRKLVKVLNGTYNDPVVDWYQAGVTVEGVGIKSLLTNANSLTHEAMSIDQDSSTVRNMAFMTGAGATGGNKDAILVEETECLLENIWIINSDDVGIIDNGGNTRIIGLQIVDTDSDGIKFETAAPFLSNVGPVFSVGGSAFVGAAAADNFMILNCNFLEESATIPVGMDNGIIDGVRMGTLQDYGTGNTSGDVE